jgi:hypothetical protein
MENLPLDVIKIPNEVPIVDRPAKFPLLFNLHLDLLENKTKLRPDVPIDLVHYGGWKGDEKVYTKRFFYKNFEYDIEIWADEKWYCVRIIPPIPKRTCMNSDFQEGGWCTIGYSRKEHSEEDFGNMAVWALESSGFNIQKILDDPVNRK